MRRRNGVISAQGMSPCVKGANKSPLFRHGAARFENDFMNTYLMNRMVNKTRKAKSYNSGSTLSPEWLVTKVVSPSLTPRSRARRISQDLEDKEEDADSKISEVYKGLARKNGPVEEEQEITTPDLSASRVGYVMDIVTTPPTPRTVNPPVNDNHVMASHLAKQNSLQNLRSTQSSLEQSPPPSPPRRLTNPHSTTQPSINSSTTQPSNHSSNRHSTFRHHKISDITRRSSRSGHSESQSISSQCDSRLSCESAGYDSDSSADTRSASVQPTAPFSNIQPVNMQLHQTSNRLRDPIFRDVDSSKSRNNHSNGTVNGGVPQQQRPSILRKPLDKDGTASETTSGVSSQDMKIRFATSDSETQTSADPSLVQSQSNLESGQSEHHQSNQTIFHLDKYTHLTKRKRSRGIPNVCTWFGMSAVEHLIQNSVNMSSWIWTQNPRSACNSNSGSNTTLLKTTCNSTPRTDRKGTPSPPPPSAPIMFPPVREWDSEKSLLEAMSDIGEQFLEGLSPATSRRGSRRGSQISLADLVSPVPGDKKKTKVGKRLGVPTKTDLASVKDSIISRCRSPRTVKKNADIPNGQVLSKSDKRNGSLAPSTISNFSNSSTKSKEEEEEKKEEEETKQEEALKKATLLELLDDDGFGDENNIEEKKKSQRSKKSGGGGGGGGRFRGGNTMMKCAMFDEVVKHARNEDEIAMEDPQRNGRLDNHHAWRNAFRSEMRTKAFQDSHFEDVAQDLEKNTDKLEELRSQAAQEKVVSKWRMRVDERRSEPDKPLTKDRSDQPPKLVRVQKTEGSNSSESVAKKWLSKSKAGRAAHTAPRRQLPATTGSKWAAAKSKTLAVNRLNNLAKHAGPLPQNNSGDATTGTRVNALKSSSAQSILANKPSSLQSSFANKPSSLQSSFANKPSSLQSSFANKPSSLQSSFANKPSSLQSSFANKPVHPSSASAAPKSAPNARANWRTAAVKSKTVGNLTKSVGSSTVGSKKPYVPYKSPAKSGMGMKPGLAAKRGPQKLGGAKMGGKFF